MPDIHLARDQAESTLSLPTKSCGQSFESHFVNGDDCVQKKHPNHVQDLVASTMAICILVCCGVDFGKYIRTYT